MIRLRTTTTGRRVIVLRLIAAHAELERGGIALSAIIPVRWFGTGLIAITIGAGAATLAS